MQIYAGAAAWHCNIERACNGEMSAPQWAGQLFRLLQHAENSKRGICKGLTIMPAMGLPMKPAPTMPGMPTGSDGAAAAGSAGCALLRGEALPSPAAGLGGPGLPRAASVASAMTAASTRRWKPACAGGSSRRRRGRAGRMSLGSSMGLS